MVYTKILGSTTIFDIDNKKHIRMISEGLCDTEDWRHYLASENSALIIQE